MMPDLDDRSFVFLDGAVGTMLQKRGLKPGERPDIMNMTAPEAVEDVQRMYAEAGSDIIYTNTFGANAAALRGTGYTPREIVTAAVGITKRACAGRAKTALDIGPIGEFIDPLGDMKFDRAYGLFKEQAVAGEDAGADLAVIETMSDLMELKAAILAVRENTRLPVLATMTFDRSGRTFAGCLPESFAIMAERLGVAALGLNCSLEPSEMLRIAERIAKMTSVPLVIKPNAGLPDSVTGLYDTTPAEFASQMAEYAKIGAKLVGGCCGTSPEYIKELRKMFEKLEQGKPEREHGAFICTPAHYERLDGFKPSGRTYESAINGVTEQLSSGARIVEVRLQDGAGPEEAAGLAAEVRELTDKPMLIISGVAEELDAALRSVCGVAAVTFAGGETRELSETAEKYGAVVI